MLTAVPCSLHGFTASHVQVYILSPWGRRWRGAVQFQFFAAFLLVSGMQWQSACMCTSVHCTWCSTLIWKNIILFISFRGKTRTERRHQEWTSCRYHQGEGKASQSKNQIWVARPSRPGAGKSRFWSSCRTCWSPRSLCRHQPWVQLLFLVDILAWSNPWISFQWFHPGCLQLEHCKTTKSGKSRRKQTGSFWNAFSRAEVKWSTMQKHFSNCTDGCVRRLNDKFLYYANKLLLIFKVGQLIQSQQMHWPTVSADTNSTCSEFVFISGRDMKGLSLKKRICA